MLKNYHPANMEIWQGRIDDENDYTSFRWHQYIKPLNLNANIPHNTHVLAFVLIGYQVDEGIALNKGRIGAKKGPDKVREQLCNKPCSFSQQLKIYDAGNVTYLNSVEDAQNTLRLLVNKCIIKNYFPIVIGGGHDLSYGSMLGIVNSLQPQDQLGLINFDAHFDFRKTAYSTSGSMFNQIRTYLLDKERSFNYLTIGVQKSGNTVSLFNYAKEINSQYILAQDIDRNKIQINKYVIDYFMKDLDKIYGCCCMDVFASCYAPGVSSPQPMGIVPDVFLIILKHLIESNKLVAFDIAEVSPSLDDSQTTASLAALIIYTIINYFGELKL
ncbi:MAG: formimidoylglutamase [Bacilli bacterium]|jgi:formiminoglutamase|nr:formimidoylglutamase [Bacilli bacterium]